MDIREQIRILAKQRGKTLSDIAAGMNATPQQLNQFLNGSPKLSTLERITDALGVDLVDLFRTPEENKTGIICPHCGKLIYLNPATKPDHQNEK